MKEYDFTAKAVSFVDDGNIQKLLVYCHEREDCKLVISLGKSQRRIAEDAAEQSKLEVIP